MKELHFKFKRDKREGLGEDANPLLITDDSKDYCAIGVFDGMGGAGAKNCESQYEGRHTQAFVASRIIRDATEKYLEQNSFSKVSKDYLKKVLTERLEKEKQNYPSQPSKLRSRVVREYPTTLAVITAMKEAEKYSIQSFWAGDSRNYLWTKGGFFQISLDDLNEENDPQENLRNDAGLANCVCAGSDFKINGIDLEVADPFVIISATDGCYGYLKTIMHFQYLLLEGLRTSSDLESWKSYIEEKLNEVTGDDMSFALVAVGFDNYSDLKSYYSNVKIEGLDSILKLEQKKSEFETCLADNKEQLDVAIQKGWNVYKSTYMSKICPQSMKSTEQEGKNTDEKSSNENHDKECVYCIENSHDEKDTLSEESLSRNELTKETVPKEVYTSSASKDEHNNEDKEEEDSSQDKDAPLIAKESNNKESGEVQLTLDGKSDANNSEHKEFESREYSTVRLRELIDKCMPTDVRDKALKYLEDIVKKLELCERVTS